MSDLIEQLRRGVDTNEPPDKTDRIMTEAAAEIARLQDYKRKQMEDIMTLGRQVGQLEMVNARLQAALEEIIDESKLSVSKGRLSWAVGIAREALAKEGK